MKTQEIKDLFAQFEAVSSDIGGIECWSAREIQGLLGYTKWENFLKVIEKAKTACEVAGEIVENHFPDLKKMVQIGSGSEREIEDLALTRYACYIIAQNGDTRKPEIAFAQTYFAVQTRKSEVIEKRLLEYERVRAREKLTQTEKQLSGVLYERGIDHAGFAIIRSKGDHALFKTNTQNLKRKLGVPDNRPISDFLPTISIKAKDLAAEMTSLNVQNRNLRGHNPIEKEHVENSSAVRDMLLKRGIQPENLPASDDVKKVQRKLLSDEKKALKTPKKKGKK